MDQTVVHEDATAALERLQATHPGLEEELSNAYGFAVFPSVGRASAVLGGTRGAGEVYEHGKPIGFATITSITIGVQLGGQTFSELLLFGNKNVLDDFKRGKTAFTANASAVLLKAAASGTTDFRDVEARAYSQGGMLLEASLGGQKFSFTSAGEGDGAAKPSGGDGESAPTEGGATAAAPHDRPGASRLQQLKNSALARLRNSNLVRHLGGGEGSPMGRLRSLFSMLQKEQTVSRALHPDVQAALKRVSKANPSLKDRLSRAYAFAVFPAVGKAGAVLGGAFGRGEVFEQGRLIGYAGVIQLTIGLQLGGETFTELLLFENEGALQHFRSGALGFAANASAVVLKAGAAISSDYGNGTTVYVFAEGGMLVEAAIGGQKFVFRPAGLTRGKTVDESTSESDHQPESPGDAG